MATNPDRPIRPYSLILRIFQRLPRMLHNTVNRERRQPHTRNPLKHGPLRHHSPIILNCRYPPGNSLTLRKRRPRLASRQPGPELPRRVHGRGVLVAARDTLAIAALLQVQDALIAQIRFVALVSDVAGQVGPRDGVGALYDIRVHGGAEGLADVGGVGDVAMCGAEDGADSGGVGGVPEGGVCGFASSVVALGWVVYFSCGYSSPEARRALKRI